MISREDIEKKYSGLSTDELLSIVRQQEGYTDLAVSVAKEELVKRNVTREREQEYEERVEEAKAIDLHKASVELNFGQKCFFYFIWIPLLQFAVKQNFREDGYLFKLRQAKYYSLAGFVAFLLTVFISIALDLPNWPAIFVWIFLMVPALALDKYLNKKPQSL